MTRLELALALGAAMALSAALGWALHALWARLVRRPDAAEARQQELMRQLADAEEARDALVAEAAAERDALHGRLEEIETELTRALHEREAELEAAMDTIGSLRREIEALRGDA